MQTLRERVEGFAAVNYGRVVRDGHAYSDTARWARDDLSRLVKVYRDQDRVSQYTRLIRDDIDQTLRRFQNYCIEERIGGHYRQLGMQPGDHKEFEHVIPLKIMRDLLINDLISVDQALQSPTCVISRHNHALLAQQGLASRTPSNWNFFHRYRSLEIEIETHDAVMINLDTWDLEQHYQKFLA